MADRPTHLIESDSSTRSRFRLAFGADNVRNSVRGLINRYPNADVIVWAIGDLVDVSSHFLLKESEDAPPF